MVKWKQTSPEFEKDRGYDFWYATEGIEGIDIALGGESVKYCDAFKYLGVILDSSLSMNQHIDHVKKKISKMLGIFSRARPSLTIESANRLFKSMILPILDYCGAVFHRCDKGNEEGLECLRRRAGRIVLNTAHLSTEQMFTSLGWDTLTRRRDNHIVKLVEKCLEGMAPSYFSKYFQFKRHHIHDYDIRNKDKLVVNRVKLESTKRAFFFIKEQIFLIIVHDSSSSLFISFYMHIKFLHFLYSFFDFYVDFIVYFVIYSFLYFTQDSC